MTKVLITGSKGLLGLGLMQSAPLDCEIVPTVNVNITNNLPNYTFTKLNILDKEAVFKVVGSFLPDVIIHAASLGNVDYCEKNQKEAYAINVVGTENIIQSCKEYGSKLIFTSSNAIFDGLTPPYNEHSTPHPLNYYGMTKLLSEEMITRSGVDFCIVRLLLMFGWNHPLERANPVTWIIDQLKNNRGVKLVNDIYNNPMLNTHAAECIWEIINKNINGIIHLGGKDIVNRYQLGVKTAQVFGLDTSLITEVSSSYFGNLAPRMPDTTYDTEKMRKDLGIEPVGLVESLNRMKKNALSKA